MNDNFSPPRQHGDVIACGEDPAGPAPHDGALDWEIGTAHTVRQVIAGCIATPLMVPGKAGRQAIEFELVTTDAGRRYRECLPADPMDQSWAYLVRKGLAAYYLRKRADFIAKGSWQVSDTTKADDLLVAMARSEAAGRG